MQPASPPPTASPRFKFIPDWLQNGWGLVAGFALVYLFGFLYATQLSHLDLGFISNLTAMPLSFFAVVAALRVPIW